MKPLHTFVVLAYRESAYLESCLQSVLHQTQKTHVVIATSTPNSFIEQLAQKYHLNLIINPESKGIGADFDFASNCVDSELVTIAHQDDLYEPKYAQTISQAYQKHPHASIIFTDYYELKNQHKEFTNTNLKIKRFLLSPLRLTALSGFKFVKRLPLRFGCPICCPAVTFVTQNVPKNKFKCSLKCNIDWFAWEKLSRRPGQFIYLPERLMAHRLHNASTTTGLINSHLRTQEDLFMLQKFWPLPIAKFINHFYHNSEQNNQIK